MKQLKLCVFSLTFAYSFTYGQIFFSEYSEGSSYNKYIEIYNYSNETVNLYPQFVLTSCTNGCIDGNNFYINEFNMEIKKNIAIVIINEPKTYNSLSFKDCEISLQINLSLFVKVVFSGFPPTCIFDLLSPFFGILFICLLYTSPSPRDRTRARMPSSA